ncbi:MAG: hypothetical protein WAW57_15180 [Lutibacter sp.]
MSNEKKEFVNPFEKGVTYTDFLNAIPKGETVEKYCNKNLTKAEVEWLLIELEHFKNNKLKK